MHVSGMQHCLNGEWEREGYLNVTLHPFKEILLKTKERVAVDTFVHSFEVWWNPWDEDEGGDNPIKINVVPKKT